MFKTSSSPAHTTGRYAVGMAADGKNPDGLRPVNRMRVVRLLTRHGPLSRAELMALTGLSRGAVGSLAAELLQSGDAVESLAAAEAAGARGGRPARRLSLTPPPQLFGAVLLGHGYVRAVLADAAGATVADSAAEAKPFGPQADYLERGAMLLDELLQSPSVDRSRLCKVTLGLPGVVDPGPGAAELLPAGRTAWPGGAHVPDALALFRSQFGVEILAENDANLAALGEAAEGAGRGGENVLYLKMAAGLGGGLVLGGRLHRGAYGLAGEVAHTPVVPDGRPCLCGLRGCLGGVADGRSIARDLHEADPQITTFEDVAERVARGEPGPVRHVRQAGRLIGRAIASACSMLALDAVILDPGLGSAGPVMAEGLGEELRDLVQPAIAEHLAVLIGQLGTDAELRGALALAIASTPDPRSLDPVLDFQDQAG